MKISGDYSKYVNGSYKKDISETTDDSRGVKKDKQHQEIRGNDSVEISKTSKDILMARSAITRDISGRLERVEQIKTAIKEGAYDISSKDVAGAMLGRLMGKEDK